MSLASTLILFPATGQAQPAHGQIFDIVVPGEPRPTTDIQEEPEDTNQVLESVSDYENQLVTLRSTEGPFSLALAEQLQGLANQYQRLDEHEAAIASLESARHIIRVNHGLFSLEQVSLVQNLIDSYSALNRIEEASQLQEYLYYLNRKNFEQDESAFQEAQLALADWYVKAHLRNPDNIESFSSSGFDGSRDLSQYVSVYDSFTNSYTYVHRSELDSFGGHSFFESHVGAPMFTVRTDPNLDKARELYRAVLPEEGADKPLVTDISLRLAGISYLIKEQVEFLESQASPYGGRSGFRRNALVTREYLNGLDILRGLQAAAETEPAATPEEIAGTLLDIADWHLSFGEPKRAAEQYRNAHAVLTTAGLTEPQISEIMAPEDVVFIPRYVARPNSRTVWDVGAGEQLDFQGYVDLRFNRDERGNLTDIVVVNRSENTSSETESQILRALSNQKSRPTIIGGETVAENNLQLRYYYTH